MSTGRHTAYNLMGQVAPLLLALATIPLYLQLIGEARYGILAIVWLLIGYFGLFDLGLGQAAAQRLSRTSEDLPAQRAKVVWTALAANLALGLVGGLVAWPLAAYLFGHQFNFAAELRQEALEALPWMVLTVPIATMAGVLSGALQARKHFLELNLVVALGNALVQLAPLAVAASLGPSLPTLVLAVFVARVLTLLVLFQRCRVHILGGQPLVCDGTVARQLLRYGGWVTVSALVSPMMVMLDRFVIGVLLGAKAVSYYTIPFQLAERATVLSAALNFALFPRLAAEREPAARLRLAFDALRALAVVMSPLIAACVLLIGPFLAWWISPEIASKSTRVAQILFMGFWINSLAMVPYTQLQAGGRPDLVAQCHLVELVPYLALLCFALQAWGLEGAAAVFSLRVAADFVLLAHFAGALAPALRLLALPGLLIALAFAVATPGWIPPSWFLPAGAALLVLLLKWSWAHAPAGLRALRP